MRHEFTRHLFQRDETEVAQAGAQLAPRGLAVPVPLSRRRRHGTRGGSPLVGSLRDSFRPACILRPATSPHPLLDEASACLRGTRPFGGLRSFSRARSSVRPEAPVAFPLAGRLPPAAKAAGAANRPIRSPGRETGEGHDMIVTRRPQ